MDDFIIIHHNKKYLKNLLEVIREFLCNNLCLSLNGKTQIYPLKHGIDFCGYRIWKTHYKLRKRNIKKNKRKFRKLSLLYSQNKINLSYIKPRLMSFLGYAKHSNNKKTVSSILNCLRLSQNFIEFKPKIVLKIAYAYLRIAYAYLRILPIFPLEFILEFIPVRIYI